MRLFLCTTLLVCGAITGSLQQRDHQHHSHCEKMCTEQYQPICGSDGKTYSNLCVYQVAACNYMEKGLHLTIKTHGACGADHFSHVDQSACDQICDEDINKLCASDGNVYNNVCLFKRAECEAAKNNTRLSIVKYADSCPEPKIPDCQQYWIDTSDLAVEGGLTIQPRCPSSRHTVCASDGQTYGSECQLCYYMDQQSVNMTISYDGPCHLSSTTLGGQTNPWVSWLNHLLHPETGDPIAG